MSENTGSSRKRKTLSAALAIVMVLTMLLSGTLAYFYHSEAINLFSNEKKAIVGHDDFGPMTIDNATGNRVYNKDVYVENTGDTPVWVRIKLREDFTLDKAPVTVGTGANADQLTQLVHKPIAGAADLGIGSEDGDEAAVADKDIHKYFTWTLGGAGKAFLSANDDLFTKDTNDSDGNGVYMSGTGDQVAHDDADKGVKTGSTENIKNIPSTEDPTKFEYMPDAEVIDMTTYNSLTEADKQAYVGWVYDTTEAGGGWAYWSQMLKPGYATGKLLDQVTVSKDFANRQYDYNIYVDFEAVDVNDQQLWTYDQDDLNETLGESTEQASTSAIVLMERAQRVYDRAEVNAKIDEKIASIEAKGANGSLGAIKAYEQAKKRSNSVLQQAYMEGAANAQASYEANKAELDQPLIKYDTTSGQYVLVPKTKAAGPTQAVVHPCIMKYLLETYGEGFDQGNPQNNVFTRAQAQGVVEIYLHKHNYYPNINDWTTIPLDITWMKAEDFPNLKSLDTVSYCVSQNFMETTDLAPQILYLGLRNLDLGYTPTVTEPKWTKEFNISAYTSLQNICIYDSPIEKFKIESPLPAFEILDANCSALQELPAASLVPNLKCIWLPWGFNGDTNVQAGYAVVDASSYENLESIGVNWERQTAHFDAIILPQNDRITSVSLCSTIKKVFNMPAQSTNGFFADPDSKITERGWMHGGLSNLVLQGAPIMEIDIHNYTGIASIDLTGCTNITKIIRNPGQTITGLDANLNEVKEYVVPLDDTLNEATHLLHTYPAAGSE